MLAVSRDKSPPPPPPRQPGEGWALPSLCTRAMHVEVVVPVPGEVIPPMLALKYTEEPSAGSWEKLLGKDAAG